MAIVVTPASITTGEVVSSVHIIKKVLPASIVSGEVIPAITYALFVPYAGGATDINVSGFASFDVVNVTPGASLVGATGRSRTPAIAFAEVNGMNIRAIPNTLVTMADPIIYQGLPRVPMIHSVSESTALVDTTSNSGDPSDDDDTPLHRFKVSTLIDPGDDEYWLEDWEETGGGLSWISAHPYRPRVFKRTERLTDHTDRVYTRSLIFNNRYVEHMWLDLNNDYSVLTVIIAATFHGYRSSEHGHYVLDAGRSTPIYTDVLDGESHDIDDNLDYRAALIYKDKKSLSGTSNRANIANGVHLQAKHDDSRKPKVLFSVFNGDDSMHGSWDIDSHTVKHGKMQPQNIRRLVLGRARNKIDRDYCSDMTVFEVLIYNEALTWKQIRTRAKRLAGRYKFDKYWD